jgi:hypothetical protein
VEAGVEDRRGVTAIFDCGQKRLVHRHRATVESGHWIVPSVLAGWMAHV